MPSSTTASSASAQFQSIGGNLWTNNIAEAYQEWSTIVSDEIMKQYGE
jgi:hypothetical protein